MASAAPAPAPLQFLRVERKPGGYALVLLCHEPVNTMGLAVWRELAATLAQLEGEQPAVRGVVFASGVTRDVFSAGNNINELYAPLTSKERYRCGGGGGGGELEPEAAAKRTCLSVPPAAAPSTHATAACWCCREFWVESNRFLARLYASPLVTVAAIRGGCVGVCMGLGR